MRQPLRLEAPERRFPALCYGIVSQPAAQRCERLGELPS
jgi:hypothetical protein